MHGSFVWMASTRLSKGYHVSGDTKVIHRYLPREVGDIVLLLPFSWFLEHLLRTRGLIQVRPAARESYLWALDPNGRRWDSGRKQKRIWGKVNDSLFVTCAGRMPNINQKRNNKKRKVPDRAL